MSAFAALDMDAATVFCSSAIILRRTALSSDFGAVRPLLRLVLSLSPSEGSSSSISASFESLSSSSTALSRPLIPPSEASMSSSSEPPSSRSPNPSNSPSAFEVPLPKVNFANFSSSPFSNASSLSISSSAYDCCLSRSSSGSAYSALSDSSCSLWLPNGSTSLSSSTSAPRLMLAPVY